MEKNTSSHQLVKEYIFEALTLLMETQEYHSISISDITRKAGVSRMAYYRNYDAKDDILLDYAKELILHFMNELKALPHIQEEDYYIRLFRLLKANPVLFTNLTKADLWKVLRTRYTEFSAIVLEQYLVNHKEAPEDKWTFYFLTGGVLNIIIRWAETGMQESPETLGRIVSLLSRTFKESALFPH